MRPYWDRPDIAVEVQWYRANPGARQMPYVNAFANVIDRVESFVPHVGMNYDFRPNSVGNVGGFLGLAPCGTPEAWRYGVSYNNPPPPCNCAREDLIPVQEVPSGLVDGTNREFFTSLLPLSNPSLVCWVNGVAQTQGLNYSLVGRRIYFTALSTPLTGSNLLVQYWVPT